MPAIDLQCMYMERERVLGAKMKRKIKPLQASLVTWILEWVLGDLDSSLSLVAKLLCDLDCKTLLPFLPFLSVFY